MTGYEGKKGGVNAPQCDGNMEKAEEKRRALEAWVEEWSKKDGRGWHRFRMAPRKEGRPPGGAYCENCSLTVHEAPGRGESGARGPACKRECPGDEEGKEGEAGRKSQRQRRGLSMLQMSGLMARKWRERMMWAERKGEEDGHRGGKG